MKQPSAPSVTTDLEKATTLNTASTKRGLTSQTTLKTVTTGETVTPYLNTSPSALAKQLSLQGELLKRQRGSRVVISKPDSSGNNPAGAVAAVRIEPTRDQATFQSIKDQLQRGYGNVHTKLKNNTRYITVGDYAAATNLQQNNMKTI